MYSSAVNRHFKCKDMSLTLNTYSVPASGFFCVVSSLRINKYSVPDSKDMSLSMNTYSVPDSRFFRRLLGVLLQTHHTHTYTHKFVYDIMYITLCIQASMLSVSLESTYKIHTFIFFSNVHIYTNICMFLYVYTYIYMYIYSYIHTYTYIYIYMCACIYLYI